MAVNDQVKAARYTALKARVKAECLRRKYVGSVSSYGSASYDYSTAPADGQVITEEHRSKLAVPLRAINASRVGDVQDTISDEDMTAMETFVTELEGKGLRASNAGCGASCTGLCQGGCYNSCSGCGGSCSDCSGCGGACSDSCSGSCSGDCKTGCLGTCSGSCRGTCVTGCQGYCESSGSAYA